jgi:glucose-6-phosphate isomerase
MKFSYGSSSTSHQNISSDLHSELISKSLELKKHATCTDFSHPEDFISLVSGGTDVALAEEIISKLGSSVRWVFVVGIGGTNLGAEAVYEALKLTRDTQYPEAIFFDAIDDLQMDAFQTTLGKIESKDLFVLLIISKSGETLETLANAHIVSKKLEEKFGSIAERTVVLTKEGSPLWNEVAPQTNKVPLRDSISDRYSVFSVIGLLPLGLLGFNIELFVSGAKNVLTDFSSNESNHVIDSSEFVQNQYMLGKTIRDYFFFVPELEVLGKWNRQLVAESLGKDGEGILPTVSIGTTDLHSMAQLYFAGNTNRMTTFVVVHTMNSNPISNTEVIQGDGLDGKNTEVIVDTIYESVKRSYVEHDLVFQEIALDGINEDAIGEYMMSMMLETVMVAYVWGVNAFNQPAVEDYKNRAHESLLS